MDREELMEIRSLVRDLMMAIDIREQIDSGTERGLVDFADGERITVPIPEDKKNQLNDKIDKLSSKLVDKVSKLKLMGQR